MLQQRPSGLSAMLPRAVRVLLPVWLIFAAAAAPAVIIEGGDGSGNTTAPSDDPGWANVGFDNEGEGSCVYLGNGWVITASHVGLGSVTLNGTTYADVPNSYTRLYEPGNSSQLVDLCMFRLQSNPTGLSSVTVSSTEPPTNAQIVAIGYGSNRATTETYWDSSWNEVSSPVRHGYAGYLWAGGNTERWGTNNITQIYGTSLDDGHGVTDVWETTFSSNGGDNEMQAAGGDSGGGVFYKSSTGWELTGIMLAVGTFENQPGSTAVFNDATYFADLSVYSSEIAQIMATPQSLFWSGTNTWDQSTTTNWSRVSGGSYSLTWEAANVVFEGNAGTVTVSDTITGVNSITFTTDGYTLGGSGAITLTGAGGNITTGAGTDTINCTIAGSVGLTKGGAGTLVLGGANTFSGLTQITAGTLQLANGNALQNSTLDYNNYGGSLSFGSLTSATFGGLQGAQALALTSTGGNVALTVGGNNAGTTYSGQLSGGGSLTKTGSGTLILSGANSYTGLTTVNAGVLQLNASAQSPVIGNGATGANVTGTGHLVLDYSATGATDPATTVKTLLTTSYNNGVNSFLSGQICNTGATSSIGLGWVDNTTTKQVTIMPAMYGDGDLDGTVGLADLNTLLTNYGKSGMVWSQGDFTYDDSVGLADLNALLTNYGQNGPTQLVLTGDIANLDSQAIQALAGAGITAVPEPSSIIMLATLAAAAVGMSARAGRRRRPTA